MRHFSDLWIKCRYSKLNLTNGMEVEETRLRPPSLLLIPLMACVALLYFVDVFQLRYYSLVPTGPPAPRSASADGALAGYVINTPGCRIPYMDPFDANVKAFVKYPEVPLCNNGTPPLVRADRDSVRVVVEALQAYNVTEPGELDCCYRSFWRVPPRNKQKDDKYAYNKTCTAFRQSAKISHEFIEVTCKFQNAVVYRDMFAFVPLKPGVSRKPPSPRPLSVLVLGYDAVSRLNLHRQMPKTVEALRQLGAVELLGYNKVADNTFPNLIPVLAGLSEGQLQKSCWPKQESYFDDCHFIWHDFKERGFVTAYGEDSSWMGLFNYQRSGFRKQTVDYAYNYFNRISEKVIGNAHNLNVDECIGPELAYRKQLEYVQNFVATMDDHDVPYFGFFWGVSLSHDYLNKPKLGDDIYTELFNGLKSEGHLNNTVVIFMSDHGIRWGGIRQTFQGRMEERLPFVMTILPDWYRKQFPKAFSNLQRNAKRLTTPYDLHETLVDLLFPYALTEEYLHITNTKSRGISLFREISKERTCEDAGIDGHWCTCQQSVEVPRNSTDVLTATGFALSHINGQLEGYAQCAALVLDEVLNSRLMSQKGDIGGGNNEMQDYMLTFRTLPGEAIFEVTVRYSPAEKEYAIMGTVSRLNLYGTQSSCITDFHLKLYCYCKSILE